MASGGGVDKGSIGGFKSAMAKYQQTANTDDASSSKPAASSSNASGSSSSSSSGGGGGQNALFAAINQGGTAGNLTSGLNKVTSDMKTKNRKDRSGKVSGGGGGGGGNKSGGGGGYSKSKAAESKEQDKDPEIKVTGSQLRISYYKKMDKILVFGSSADDPEEANDPTPAEYKIYDANPISMKNDLEFWNADTANFRISKKCKSVKLYNCKNVQIEVRSVVSTIEITNCNKVNLYVKEKAGSIVLEKCDGAKIVLFPAAASSDPSPQLYTTLCQNTELSISQGDDADPLDVPVPSQFVTQCVDGKWKTAPVEHV